MFGDSLIIFRPFILVSLRTLVVPTASFNVTEPDGETVNVTICFEAYVDQPRFRDAEFELVFSTLSIASPNEYILATAPLVIIPATFTGFYRACADVTVFGDEIVEEDEVIIVDVRPLSFGDMVQFPNGSDSIRLYIIDDDGKYPEHGSLRFYAIKAIKCL